MRRHRHRNAEPDAIAFPGDYATVAGYRGIAFYVLGWETEPDEDTEWSGMEQRTGRVLVVMVGDDRRHAVEREDVTPLDPSGFCHGCGQIGCGHNVPDAEG